MSKIAITVLTLLLITSNAFSQSNFKLIDTVTIKSQFEYVMNNSSSLNDNKVIRNSWLIKLKSNVLDSLSASKNKVLLNSDILISQKKMIDSLNLRLSDSEVTISNLIAEKESISLFGMQLDKSVFKTLAFIIIIVLFGMLGFFIIKFRQNSSITNQCKLALTQNEEEFAIYREKALEREQKAMRRLQDELNKNKKES